MTRKKLEKFECRTHGPRVMRNKEGKMKTKGNLNIYLSEALHISNVDRREENSVTIGRRDNDIIMCGTLPMLLTEGGDNYIKEERAGGIKRTQNLLKGNASNYKCSQHQDSTAIRRNQAVKLAKYVGE